jgi:NADP-dependent 3-hydroxy acid dehydrogenase YdfG
MINIAGKYPLCVSNTYGATKMYINADISQIKRFRERQVS